jgi:hypothetical protein
MAKQWRGRTRRTAMLVVYTILGVYALGYWPTRLIAGGRGAQVAMVLIAVTTIPYGASARSVVKGFLMGAAIGLWGGLWTAYALIHNQTWTERAIWIAILGTGGLCAAVGTIFAYLARKRAEKLEELWNQ